MFEEDFNFEAPALTLDQTPDNFWSDLDSSLAGQAGLSDMGWDMPAAPSDSYWTPQDASLAEGAGLYNMDWYRTPQVGSPLADFNPYSGQQSQIDLLNGYADALSSPWSLNGGLGTAPKIASRPQPASLNDGVARFPDGTPVPKMKSDQEMAKAYQFKIPSDTEGEFGKGNTGKGSRGGGGGGSMAGMIQAYNDAVARARNAAEGDRNQALSAVAQWRNLIDQRLSQNPFGAEYKAQTLGVVRDARARQYQAAVEELRQAYAQQGKPLDPRLLVMLRMQMAREENGDLRNLSVDTAGKAYAADQTYVNEVGNTVTALDRILSNTQRMPNPQELAFLMSLANSGGIKERSA